ncbi:MAG: hypothetical protein OSB62_02830 [Alphaproteobacteria bacterium]|nr:hypothetical protein [Alphaproteobacteria bacterium]
MELRPEAGFGLAAILFIPIVFVLFMAFAIFLGYIGGSIFDGIMGTNATPIWMFAGLVGVYSSGKTELNGDFTVFGKFIIGLAMIPIAAFFSWFLAIFAVWFAPGTAYELTAMIGFDGNFQSLAFWGTLVGASIRFIPSIITAGIALASQ